MFFSRRTSNCLIKPIFSKKSAILLFNLISIYGTQSFKVGRWTVVEKRGGGAGAAPKQTCASATPSILAFRTLP